MSAPPGPASKSRLINDLEILRGFGLFVVILHHMQGSLLSKVLFTEGPWPSYQGGGAVLDLFFAISGYIITRNLLPQLCEVGKIHGGSTLEITGIARKMHHWHTR